MEEVAKRFFPVGFKFAPPFTYAQTEGGVCFCVGCGRSARATIEVGTYPHKYLPQFWKLGGPGSTHCNYCETDKFDYWITYDVAITVKDTRDSRSYSPSMKVAIQEEYTDIAGNLYKWDPNSEGYVMYTSEMRTNKNAAISSKREIDGLTKALASGHDISNTGEKNTMSEKIKKAAKNEVSSINEAIVEGAKLDE